MSDRFKNRHWLAAGTRVLAASFAFAAAVTTAPAAITGTAPNDKAAGKAPAAAAAQAKGYFNAGFELLAGFPFNPPEPDPAAKPGTPPLSAANQIPATVKALDGKKVIVTGYMMPVKMEKGLVTELLLVRSQQLCCFGATPQINEFIVVKMVSGGVKALADVPVEFYGRLSVKEVFEEGYLSHIYALDAEKMGKSAVE